MILKKHEMQIPVLSLSKEFIRLMDDHDPWHLWHFSLVVPVLNWVLIDKSSVTLDLKRSPKSHGVSN